MEILIPAEVLGKSLNTLKGYVHKPGSSSLAMSATHIIADAGEGRVTFVGNNPAQRLEFSVKAEVKESGEALVSVADTLTALSTILDKSQPIRVALEEDGLGIHSKTVSVTVPTLDLGAGRTKPVAPSRFEGSLARITVKAEDLPRLFTRAVPATVGSKFPKMMLWVDEDELCLMSLGGHAASFASASGASAVGSSDLIVWDPDNLRRVIGLTEGAKTLTICIDDYEKGNESARASFTILVEAEDVTFIVEQTLEREAEKYAKARSHIARGAHQVLSDEATSVTVKAADIVRAMESADRVRAIGRDTANIHTTILSLDEGLLRVSLADESFDEEIPSAKTKGVLPRRAEINAPYALALANSLGSDAKITLHLTPVVEPDPGMDGKRRTSHVVLTCQDTVLTDSEQPAKGYWGMFVYADAPK